MDPGKGKMGLLFETELLLKSDGRFVQMAVSTIPEIKEVSIKADDGQYLQDVLLTFCAHFYYYANEAVSSNCIKNHLLNSFWMARAIYNIPCLILLSG